MDELLLKYDKLIYMMANKYKNYASIDDLYQAGCIGLKEALTHYDESKGSDLTSYICLYIKGEMLKEVSNSREIRVGYDVYNFSKKVKEARDYLTQEFGREATTYEVAYYMNENIEKIEMIDRVSMPVYHLDDRNEDNLSLYDKVSYVEKAYDTDILDLKSACDKLNSYEKSLINNRYYLDKTQQEVAETLGISQVKVSREEKKILEKLRVSLTTN